MTCFGCLVRGAVLLRACGSWNRIHGLLTRCVSKVFGSWFCVGLSNSGLTCYSGDAGAQPKLRHLLHLATSDYTSKMNDRQLSSLLYRDHLGLKHATRQRLQHEVEAAKLVESAEQERLDRAAGRILDKQNVENPLLNALLSHLPEDAW